MAVRDTEVDSTQAPTLPQLMPLMSGPHAWYRRSFVCSKGRHKPVWSREQNEPAKTRYCEFCGVVMGTNIELTAEPPSTGGRVLTANGFNIHGPVCEVFGHHEGGEMCEQLVGLNWGEAEGRCECGLAADHTRECAE